MQVDWNVFESEELGGNFSVEILNRLCPALCNSVENKIRLYQSVLAMRKNKAYDATVGSLKNDAREIDKLSEELGNLQSYQLESLFHEPNIIEQIILKPDLLKSFTS